MKNKLEELKAWLAQFPEGSDILVVDTSIWEDDALIYVQTPDKEIHSHEVMGERAHR